jgi:hypothetical protein
LNWTIRFTETARKNTDELIQGEPYAIYDNWKPPGLRGAYRPRCRTNPAGGSAAALKAGEGGPSTFLHFLLVPTADLDKPLEAPPAVVQELYRTVAPLPALKHGRRL